MIPEIASILKMVSRSWGHATVKLSDWPIRLDLGITVINKLSGVAMVKWLSGLFCDIEHDMESLHEQCGRQWNCGSGCRSLAVQGTPLLRGRQVTGALSVCCA